MTALAGDAAVAVALCDGLAGEDAADLAELCQRLESGPHGVHAEVVPGLCGDSDRGPALATRVGAARLVLGVCADGEQGGDVQRRARHRGLDPFAVEMVRLPPAGVSRGNIARVEVLLGAAVARARAFGGSAPEQLRPRLITESTGVSRRSLLSLPPLVYEPVAAIDRARCRDGSSCRLCVDVCPRAALAVEGRSLRVDKDRCDGCGLCLVACPPRALDVPGSSLEQHEAQLRNLLDTEAPAILFRGRGVPAGEGCDGWLAVDVRCTGMVTPGWLLQALAGGAVAVALAPCADGCRTCEASVAKERAGYVGTLLRLLGDEAAAERVRLVEPASGGAGEPPRLAPLPSGGGQPRLNEPSATADALLRLGASALEPEECALVNPASPLGLVRVRASSCTACGACAAVCPTGALRLEHASGDEAVLTYDGAACVGCGRCAPACPEQRQPTLRVTRGVDLPLLSEGRVTLHRSPLLRCRNCGGPVAPHGLVGRVRALLGEEQEAESLLRLVGELCIDCRGAALADNGRRPPAGLAAESRL